MVIADDQLKTLLEDSKALDKKAIKALSTAAKNSQSSLYETALEKGFLSDKQLGQLLADSLQLPFVELSTMLIPEETFQIIPERIARTHKIIAFEQDEETIKLGMADPTDTKIAEIIAKKVAKTPLIHLATENDIATTLQAYKKNLQDRIDDLVKQELGTSLNVADDSPIIKIVDAIITSAYREKASDVHIEPQEENVLVRFRIDSVLHDVLQVDKNLHGSIVTRIKVLAKLRTDEHLDSQDGKLRMMVDDENLDVRVSVIPTTEGEKIVLRLLSSKFRSFSLADLGMSQKDLDIVHDAISRADGMVLSTGPTGSGKTTSIYSLIKILNTRERNITTIEDPVEYRIKGVNHIPVNSKTGFTFARGLRSILRQDPDIIFVGEIRDPETASLAVNAALTGHLVLSTLHTNDAATALLRLVDMGVEPFLLASTVNVIIAQRLVRKICEVCKTKVTIKRETLDKNIPDKIWKQYFGTKKEITAYQGKGCKICHFSGYSGRVGLFEVMEVSEKIRSLIMQRENAKTMTKVAITEGMTTLLDDGIKKVMQGTTTMQEVLRVIKIERI